MTLVIITEEGDGPRGLAVFFLVVDSSHLAVASEKRMNPCIHVKSHTLKFY